MPHSKIIVLQYHIHHAKGGNYGKLVSGKNYQEHIFPNHKYGKAKPSMGFTDNK